MLLETITKAGDNKSTRLIAGAFEPVVSNRTSAPFVYCTWLAPLNQFAVADTSHWFAEPSPRQTRADDGSGGFPLR